MFLSLFSSPANATNPTSVESRGLCTIMRSSWGCHLWVFHFPKTWNTKWLPLILSFPNIKRRHSDTLSLGLWLQIYFCHLEDKAIAHDWPSRALDQEELLAEGLLQALLSTRYVALGKLLPLIGPQFTPLYNGVNTHSWIYKEVLLCTTLGQLHYDV